MLLETYPGPAYCSVLLLLPGRYPVDAARHALCAARGLRDPYLLGGRSEYTEPTVVNVEGYYGYRQTYHRLLYADDLTPILRYWGDYGADCTLDAVRD